MSYQLRFEGKALVQLGGLPSAAFDAIVSRVVDLVDEPWDAVVMTRGGDPADRQVTFGQGYGFDSEVSELVGGSPGCADRRDPAPRAEHAHTPRAGFPEQATATPTAATAPTAARARRQSCRLCDPRSR